VDRVWLKQYPPGVPADIDPDQYASLKALVEEAFAKHRAFPAYTNMGATLSYAQLDELSRAFGAWLQHKAGLSPGDRVELQARPGAAYVVRLGRTTFYERARRKLRLTDSAEIIVD